MLTTTLFITIGRSSPSREGLPGLQQARRWKLAEAPLHCKEGLVAIPGGPPCSPKRTCFLTPARK